MKRYVMYFLVSLPLALICYEGFMTLAVGTRAWPVLLVGQALLVPIAAYVLAIVFNMFYSAPLLGSSSIWRITMDIIFFGIALVPIIVLSVYYGTLGNALT